MEQEENKQKTSSTGNLKDGMEAKTPINWKNGHTMSMFHESISRLWIIPGNLWQ